MPRRWWSATLAVAGATAFVVALLLDSAPAPVAEVPARSSLPQAGAGAPIKVAPRAHPADHTKDRLRGVHLSASEPVSIRIPALALALPLSGLGLASDGTLETPRSGDEVGWFTGSATPGALGPAVIAAHVTWGGAPAAFHELATLDRLDRVLVRREDGKVAVFAVTDVARFAKSGFPTGAVYGATDHAALRLITCGGRFDAVRSRYEDNVVVFGRLVAVRGPGRPVIER